MRGLESNSATAVVARASAPPRITLATDGSEESRGAAELVSCLAHERSVAVQAVAAVVPSHALSTHHRSDGPIDDARRCDVPELVEQSLSEVAGSEDWTKRAVRGWPADVVNEAAHDWGASLIVVGLGRHGPLDRLFGAETAINIIKHATIPVLAVPADATELPQHACAAIDFTPASVNAAIVAASLLGEGGKLTLLHASPYVGVEAETDPVAQLYRAAAGKQLAEVLAVVRMRTRHHVDGLILDGEPAPTIVDFVRNEHCGLVALGGHPQGLVDRILIGGIRTRVLRAVECAVLVAPPEHSEA